MHWKHSDFQLCYQLVGDCHTIDEAIRVACMLREERHHSILIVGAESDRAKAKIIFSETTILSKDDTLIDKLNAQANLAEQLARNKLTDDTFPHAEHEIEVLDSIIEYLIPKSKLFANVGDEAFQLIQSEENFYHCYWTSYLNLLSSGFLTSELLQSIKLHPLSETLDLLVDKLRHDFQNPNSNIAVKTKFEVLSSIDYALSDNNNSRFLVSGITGGIAKHIGLDDDNTKFNALPSNIQRIAR